MTNNVDVSEVDFQTIKDNLKEYLKNQSEFADYDFDGSGLNTLLDILAYNTHYNTVYSNLAFSETFLDSAVQRSSVVSRAKEVGYTPYSKQGAQAVINISFSVTGNPNEFVLPQGTRFTASAGGESFNFVTTSDLIIENDGNDIFTANIRIYQGQFTTYDYTVDLNDASQRFIIPSRDADTRFLSVLHKDSVSQAEFTPWASIDDVSIGDLTSTSEVFFLRESYDEFFEVYFGDDVIGKAIQNNNIVRLSYLITDGLPANGATSFVLTSAISGVTSASVTTIEAASGGGDKESINSIKYLAPFYYQSQDRAVTSDDYKAIITNNYADVDDIQVWGGEENDPPFYGKVFIAIKPKATSFFSNAVKQTIENDVINRFNVLSVRPEIVDPDYINVAVETVVTYNARLYNSATDNTLESDIRATIEAHFANEANKFGQPLYYSQLVGDIDDTSNLIINSVTNLTLSKEIEIIPSVSSTYTYRFNNSLHPGAITSNEFLIGGVAYRIRDIPTGAGPHDMGTVAIFRTTQQGQVVFLTRNSGTIDYNTGEIIIQNIAIDSIVDDPIENFLRVSVSPGALVDTANAANVYTDYNVYTNERDQIVRLDPDNPIMLTLLPDESV